MAKIPSLRRPNFKHLFGKLICIGEGPTQYVFIVFSILVQKLSLNNICFELIDRAQKQNY